MVSCAGAVRMAEKPRSDTDSGPHSGTAASAAALYASMTARMERFLRVFMAGLPVRDASSIADGAGVDKGRWEKGEKKKPGSGETG